MGRIPAFGHTDYVHVLVFGHLHVVHSQAYDTGLDASSCHPFQSQQLVVGVTFHGAHRCCDPLILVDADDQLPARRVGK